MTVALETTFTELNSQFKRLQDNLVALRLTIAEDKPLTGEAMLVDRLEDSTTETMGLIEECLSASRSAQRAWPSRRSTGPGAT